MLPSSALCRSLAAALAVVLGFGVLGGCGDDDAAADGGSASTSETTIDAPAEGAGGADGADVLTSAGDAAAAQGAGLDEAPGPADRVRFGDFGEVAIAVTAPDGTVTGWCVLLAETEAQRQRGLMEVTDLQGFAGMLFVWNEDANSSFYMRNTPTPLSIAWVNADGELVSTADMVPCADVDSCPLYPAEDLYRFALEVPQGKLDDMGLVEGSTLAVGGSCAPASDSG